MMTSGVSGDATIDHNNRPVQELGDRTVTYSDLVDDCLSGAIGPTCDWQRNLLIN